ncbi:MAG: hypothetical protein NTZ33_14350 [Bacteroidetes bacterium]|nr:hypothetical protein [Bacteroidota bacterium]
MKKVTLLAGPIGCGKTTKALELAKDKTNLIIGADGTIPNSTKEIIKKTEVIIIEEFVSNRELFLQNIAFICEEIFKGNDITEHVIFCHQCTELPIEFEIIDFNK